MDPAHCSQLLPDPQKSWACCPGELVLLQHALSLWLPPEHAGDRKGGPGKGVQELGSGAHGPREAGRPLCPGPSQSPACVTKDLPDLSQEPPRGRATLRPGAPGLRSSPSSRPLPGVYIGQLLRRPLHFALLQFPAAFLPPKAPGPRQPPQQPLAVSLEPRG